MQKVVQELREAETEFDDIQEQIRVARNVVERQDHPQDLPLPVEAS